VSQGEVRSGNLAKLFDAFFTDKVEWCGPGFMGNKADCEAQSWAHSGGSREGRRTEPAYETACSRGVSKRQAADGFRIFNGKAKPAADPRRARLPGVLRRPITGSDVL